MASFDWDSSNLVGKPFDDCLKAVDAELAHIRWLAVGGITESAHPQEDALYKSVLRRIASGDLTAPQASELARHAIEAETIEYQRYYD